MAVWGAPVAHEDDAERAVRAGLELVARSPGIGGRVDVQVRAGVLTGEAAVTVGATGQGMVAGDLVNTASPAVRWHHPVPSWSASRLIGRQRSAISFEEAGEQLLKGKQAPVPAWRAASVVAAAPRFGSRRTR